MLSNMVVEEALENIELIIILEMELITLLCLKIVVGLVLVAILDDVLFQFLLSLCLESEDEAVF